MKKNWRRKKRRRSKIIFITQARRRKKQASPLPPEQLHSSAVTKPGARRTPDHGSAVRWIRLSARAFSQIKSAGGNFVIKGRKDYEEERRRRKRRTILNRQTNKKLTRTLKTGVVHPAASLGT